MAFNKIGRRDKHLNANQFQTYALETADDLADQASLDTVRLDDYQRALVPRM